MTQPTTKQPALPAKTLRSLYWAEVHMREAASAARLLQSPQELHSELEHVLFTGMVVSYCRPFGANQGLSTLSGTFRQFDDSHLKHIHETLILARDRIYAHHDLVAEGDSALPLDQPKEEVQKILMVVALGDDNKKHVNWVVSRSGLPRDRCADYLKLFSFQEERLKRASSDMLGHFIKEAGITRPLGQYVLGENFP